MASLSNGAQTTVAVGATEILAAPTVQGSSRQAVVIQNVHATVEVRVGIAAVAATTGIKLAAGETLILEGAACPQNALYAIRVGGSDGTVFVTAVA